MTDAEFALACMAKGKGEDASALMAEVGAPSGTETWFGVLAPAGTPAEVVDKVSAVMERVARAPDFAATMLPLSMYPLYMGPREFADRIPRDIAIYRDIIRRTGIQASD